MEPPPPPPQENSANPASSAKRPLGRAFFVPFWIPIGAMAVAALAGIIAERNSALQSFAMVLSMVDLLAMLVCSIMCSVVAGQRKGAGWGVLTFICLQVLYITIGFAGCALTFGRMDYR